MFSPNTAAVVIDVECPLLDATTSSVVADGHSGANPVVSYTKHPNSLPYQWPMLLAKQISNGISSASDGRVTHSIYLQGIAKGGERGKEGREKWPLAYCAAENIALLMFITASPCSFNASDGL